MAVTNELQAISSLFGLGHQHLLWARAGGRRCGSCGNSTERYVHLGRGLWILGINVVLQVSITLLLFHGFC